MKKIQILTEAKQIQLYGGSRSAPNPWKGTKETSHRDFAQVSFLKVYHAFI